MTRLPSKFFAALVCATAAGAAHADDALWKTVQEEPNIVLLVRHGELQRERGRNGLAYDASGQCQGETMLSELGRKNAERVGQVDHESGQRNNLRRWILLLVLFKGLDACILS